MVKRMRLVFSVLVVGILGCFCSYCIAQETADKIETDKLPISVEKVNEIIGRIAFRSQDDESFKRLGLVVQKAAGVSVPSWFNETLKLQLNTDQLQRPLNKPIFRFRTDTHVRFLAINDDEVVISYQSKNILVNAQSIPALRYREMAKSDYFVGKPTTDGVFIFCDQPGFPLLYVDANGELIWEASLFKPNGYTRLEIEIIESGSSLICFATGDGECSVQAYDKKNGFVKFWWSSLYAEGQNKGVSNKIKKNKKGQVR